MSKKSGAPRLGFALLLTFFEIETRFLRYAEEIPSQTVGYVVEQLLARVDSYDGREAHIRQG